jgi:transcription-repair coupling factor (superfamily II helicase)
MNSIEWSKWDEINKIESDIQAGASIAIDGLSDTQRHHMFYSLVSKAQKKAVYVSANDLQARKAYKNFQSLFGDGVIYFSPREKMLYDVEAKSHEQSYQRIECLNRLLSDDYTIAIFSCESLLDLYMPADEFRNGFLYLKTGNSIKLGEVISKLIDMGYEREQQVEGRGQFAVRGGILDVFPIQLQKPVRIELFDIEIDSIRVFETDSQRSVDTLEYIDIYPAREFMVSKENAGEIVKRVNNELKDMVSGMRDKAVIDSLNTRFTEYIDKLKNAENFPGIDKFIPYFYEKTHHIFEYINVHNLILMEDIARLKQRLGNVLEEHNRQCEILFEKGMLLPGSYSMYLEPDELPERLEKYQTVYMNSLGEAEPMTYIKRRYLLRGQNIEPYHGQFPQMKKEIREWLSKGYLVTVLATSEQRSDGLKKLFEQEDIRVITEYPKEHIPCVVLKHGSLENGFVYPEIKWVVVCESDIGESKKRKVSPQFKESRKINVFTDLKVGDFVVHQTHGIGLYTGIESLVVEKVKKEYLKIEYRDGGFLYIPTTQIDLIQKYIGVEGKTPKVNKLGGSEWTKAKKKVKESLKELAIELIRLEAERNAKKGFEYSSDTVWQKQFEEMFEWDETNDQLRCTEEIKKDMESPQIMDRLLCGDVGYGKTEVALRAVFKAAMDGKQSAFLVPTTVLASQHFETFKKRFGSFPVTVDMLSRFRTDSEARKIIKELKTGRIDVVIGTHKLFNKEIRFKDLGLLVIDEEQRFGVGHKEKIKSLYPQVDILTLSATPIPRTLHMSLTGIRDISTIEEPPEQRYPVQTYVLEYRDDIIEDAVIRELAREGQVFYLFNRVKGIQARASRLQEMFPQAKVGYAHGQMSERQLERIILSFINKEFDILVCTTIIESGIDMPNVNTIIVEDADRLGLAQLYQLRGRVGRSNRLAYAYLTYRKDKVLNEVAEKRLKAIREFTEFGSGFKIAMRDLQIRGAGNLLGPQQHGHMEAVGYDTYVKLLEETIKELKGLKVREENEVFIEFMLDAYLDSNYIQDEQSRLDMYKTIAAIETEDEAMDVCDELIDRYGEIPKETSNLIEIALVKSLAGSCGFNMVRQKDDTVMLFISDQTALPLSLLSELIQGNKGRLMFSAGKTPYLSLKAKGMEPQAMLDNIKILLQDIQKLQSRV